MSNYTQIKDFSAKDALSAGDTNKRVIGADLDAEFNAIRASITSKWDSDTVVAIGNGGTGSTSAADARTALELDTFATADLDINSTIREIGATWTDTGAPYLSDSYTMTSGDFCILWIHASNSAIVTSGNYNYDVSVDSSSTGGGYFFADQSTCTIGHYVDTTNDPYDYPAILVSIPFTCNSSGEIVFRMVQASDLPENRNHVVYFQPIIFKMA